MKRTLSVLLLVLFLFSACSGVTLIKTQESAAPTAEGTAAPEETANIPETTAPAVSETETETGTAAPEQQTTGALPAPTQQTEPAAQTTAPPSTAAPTTAAPTTAAPTTQKPADTCTVRIECGTIKNNMNKLKAGKAFFVPESGVILNDTVIALEPGDTVFTVLERACRQNVCTDNCQYCKKMNIQLEYTYTPGFNTYYIEGIHQLYEKDCGSLSGWMFSVNGRFPEAGASSVTVSPGDRIVFAYTCDMGDDIGNHFEG